MTGIPVLAADYPAVAVVRDALDRIADGEER